MKKNIAQPSAKSNQHILTAAKGGGIMFFGDLFENGSRFAIGFLMARLLGAEQIGLCNLVMSAAVIASGLALLGMPSAIVHYVSSCASRRDTAKLWGTLQIGLGLTGIASLCVGIGLFALADPVAERVFHEPRLSYLLRMVSLAVPFLTLNSIVLAATRGFKRMEYSVIGRSIPRNVVRLVLLVAFAATIGLSATRALVAYIVAIIVAFFVLVYLFNRLFSLNRPLRGAQYNPREMLRFALPIYLKSLVNIFGGNIKSMLLGALGTVTSVGIFAVASQINTVGRLFHGSIVTASAPIVSELYDQGGWGQMKHVYQTVTKWTFTANLPLFLIILLFPVSILSVFGESFVGGATALVIMAWANLVNTGTGICGSVLTMTENTSLKLVNSIVTFALTVGLDVLLIPRWDLVGAAIASLASVVIINLLRLIEVYVLFRLLPYNASFIKPLVAGAAALVTAVVVRQLLPPEASLVYAAIGVMVLLAVYVSTIILLGLSSEDRAVLARVGQRVTALLPR